MFLETISNQEIEKEIDYFSFFLVNLTKRFDVNRHLDDINRSSIKSICRYSSIKFKKIRSICS